MLSPEFPFEGVLFIIKLQKQEIKKFNDPSRGRGPSRGPPKVKSALRRLECLPCPTTTPPITTRSTRVALQWEVGIILPPGQRVVGGKTCSLAILCLLCVNRRKVRAAKGGVGTERPAGCLCSLLGAPTKLIRAIIRRSPGWRAPELSRGG